MLSHINDKGQAKMVDISEKKPTVRVAVAKGTVSMKPETLQLIKENGLSKGDVLAVAKTAGIMAAKKTAELIPMCHPIALTNVKIDFTYGSTVKGQGATEELSLRGAKRRGNLSHIEITSTAKTTDKTGVEMEALTAATVAGLTIYDMAKSADKSMEIGPIYLQSKSGGRSGQWSKVK
ncbi:MAG: cyclic pyranopterin monophosphate synthase MoaC [Actinobacteria bacterium]|nr:MAG: cyclic pyranopterin monophosphate synthase MoaC [Actinomycetota bacterium]